MSQHRVLAGKRLQEAPFLTQVDIISQSHGARLTGATKMRQGKADSIVLRAQDQIWLFSSLTGQGGVWTGTHFLNSPLSAAAS